MVQVSPASHSSLSTLEVLTTTSASPPSLLPYSICCVQQTSPIVRNHTNISSTFAQHTSRHCTEGIAVKTLPRHLTHLPRSSNALSHRGQSDLLNISLHPSQLPSTTTFRISHSPNRNVKPEVHRQPPTPCLWQPPRQRLLSATRTRPGRGRRRLLQLFAVPAGRLPFSGLSTARAARRILPESRHAVQSRRVSARWISATAGPVRRI